MKASFKIQIYRHDDKVFIWLIIVFFFFFEFRAFTRKTDFKTLVQNPSGEV